MKEIQLTKGQVAIVDDEDYEWLKQWKWHAVEACGGGFYAKGTMHTRNIYYMHRVILEKMLGRPIDKKMCADHINGSKLDNRRCNLREVTQSINRYNSARCKNAGGAYFDKRGKSYYAYVSVNGKTVNAGRFATEEEANRAFWEMKRRVIGGLVD